LLIICLGSAGWAFSFGLGAPLASVWLKHAGFSDTLIGLNTAIYYGGLGLAALAVPRLMRRWGPACCVLGMAISGVSVALYPWGTTLAWWFALRLLNGVAGAMTLIPLETYVNRDLPAAHRARNFGLYAVALTLGWALGSWLGLEMVADRPRLAFFVGGAGSLAAAVLVSIGLPPIRLGQESATGKSQFDWRGNFLSFGSAWSQGFLEGGMVAFLSLYLLALNLKEYQVGWLTSTTMIGVILFQVPVAWLADRCGRRPVLLVCYALVVIGLVGLPLAGTSPLLPVWLCLVGACSGAFYPLGLAILGERLPESQLDRANAWYLSLECLGSLMGPALMGVARDWGGETAMFAVGEAAVIMVLAGWLVLRRLAAPAPFSPWATAVAGALPGRGVNVVLDRRLSNAAGSGNVTQ
jgi:MFS family permease